MHNWFELYMETPSKEIVPSIISFFGFILLQLSFDIYMPSIFLTKLISCYVSVLGNTDIIIIIIIIIIMGAWPSG